VAWSDVRQAAGQDPRICRDRPGNPRRKLPLEYHGAEYQIPIPGGTGLGKPLKLMFRPLRAAIPIYLAAIRAQEHGACRRNCGRLVADILSPQRMQCSARPWKKAWRRPQAKRLSSTSLRLLRCGWEMTSALGREAVKPALALYIGGMGAKNRNFYYNLACRYGFEEAAVRFRDPSSMAGVKQLSPQSRTHLWTRCLCAGRGSG